MMRQSSLFAPTLREAPAEAEAASHQLLLRAGMIRQTAAGVYTYLPLAWRVLRKLEQIVREEMDRTGAQELRMPSLQPAELWQESGRYDAYGAELVRLRDRHEREFALGPTHEEVVTALVREELHSYRQLPMTLYQIQTKFRDERRPRYGLLRGREFLMKDAYSFDIGWDGLGETYRRMHEAYERIFRRCGVDVRVVEADAGAIGGEGGTHEFMALADIGEDTIATCGHCGYAANLEKAEVRAAAPGDACPRCNGGALQFCQGIEVGQIFKLGTKYSEKLNAVFTNATGQVEPIIMGCYGIGVSRLLSAVAEQHHDEAGLIWPWAVAPFHVHLVPVSVRDEAQMTAAEGLYRALTSRGVEVLMDDREERPGVKFKDADLLGIPVRIVVGKRAGEGFVEYKERDQAEVAAMTVEEAVDRVLARMTGSQ